MKRRASIIGKRGAGIHQPQTGQQTRPAGQIKKIVSKSKHGKMIQDFHDTDEEGPDFSNVRTTMRGCLFALALIAIFAVAMCAATVAHGQKSPDIEFKSLFQIRAALPDTVLLIHTGYNIRVNAAGVECVPLNADTPPGPPISVQTWIQGDSGEWIGVTRSGATVTLFNCCGASMYLEIETPGQVVNFYNMVPGVLHWKERNKM